MHYCSDPDSGTMIRYQLWTSVVLLSLCIVHQLHHVIEVFLCERHNLK
jgi:hypothetical protein